MAKIRPLDDRVVIEVLDAEEKTTGGIILPDNAQEKPEEPEYIMTVHGIGYRFVTPAS